MKKCLSVIIKHTSENRIIAAFQNRHISLFAVGVQIVFKEDFKHTLLTFKSCK